MAVTTHGNKQTFEREIERTPTIPNIKLADLDKLFTKKMLNILCPITTQIDTIGTRAHK